MATTTSLSAAPFDPSRQIEWCFLFLEHLNEFATLAWHLVADSKPIEYLIWRALARLEDIPFDTTLPLLTYNQARNMLIAEAIIYLHVQNDQHQEEAMFADQPSRCELPHPPRLASLRETALRSSEADLARFFQVSQKGDLNIDFLPHYAVALLDQEHEPVYQGRDLIDCTSNRKLHLPHRTRSADLIAH